MRSSPDVPPSLLSAALDVDSYLTDQGESDPAPLHGSTSSNIASALNPPTPHPVPPLSQQLAIIHGLKNEAFVVGSVWFLVAKEWYTRWEDVCSERISKDSTAPPHLPGPIDNTPITQVTSQPETAYDLVLTPPVVEGESAEFIPKQAHELLVQWLGLINHDTTSHID
jgi:ubiquitin carboxyl-terminal hydrolase 4/11/15